MTEALATATTETLPPGIHGTCRVCKRQGHFPDRPKSRVWCPNCGTIKKGSIDRPDVQAILNELVFNDATVASIGVNKLLAHPSCADILCTVNLTPGQVTQKMLDKAEAACQKRLRASLNGKAESDVPTPTKNESEDNMHDMKISEADARDLLIAMGKPNVKKMSRSTLASRLNNFEKLLDGAKEPEDKDMLALMRRVGKAVADGGKIEVSKETKAHERNGQVKPVKPAKKEKGATDKFGCAVDSHCAKVNRLLSKTPQTEVELRKKAGLKNCIAWHLDKLVRLGELKWKRDHGYYIPA